MTIVEKLLVWRQGAVANPVEQELYKQGSGVSRVCSLGV